MEVRTPKSGRNAGNPCRVYSCTTQGCVNDKGYPNAVWVPIQNVQPGALNTKFRPSGNVSQTPKSTLEAKVDQILAVLKANFPSQAITTSNVETINESATPF